VFRRPHRAPSAIPIRRVIPSVITALSLCAGLASMHFSVKAALGGTAVGPGGINDWDRALALIAIAAVLDALDGRAARLLRATSRFGAVLDSLADFLAFGVAPALLLHLWLLKDADIFGLAAVMAFVLCSALRLARFTSARPVSRTNPIAARFFEGLPTPAAAGIVLVPPLLATSTTVASLFPSWRPSAELGQALVVGHTFLIAWLMVSRVPMLSFKKVKIKRKYTGQLLAVVALAAAAMIRDPWLTLAVLSTAYLLTLPYSIFSRQRARAAAQRPIAPEPNVNGLGPTIPPLRPLSRAPERAAERPTERKPGPPEAPARF
jgi:CDP-diacylglycerol--serine O-phosphatidyltransferase